MSDWNEETLSDLTGKLEVLNGRPRWKHVSGALVYESYFWSKSKRELAALGQDTSDMPTWKLHRAGEVYGTNDEEDDGYIYLTREDAMAEALKPWEAEDE